MDLLSILPDFPCRPYNHILPPLERNHISTVDLITLDPLEIAKRAHVPPADVRRLTAHLLRALHQDLGFDDAESNEPPSSSLDLHAPLVLGKRTVPDCDRWSVISTLDPALDALLEGGLPTGYVTEVTGESASGKTQFLLSLLLSVQLPPPRGLHKSAIYISTEAPLSTPRLSQMLETHPYLSSLSKSKGDRDRDRPSLENVLAINAMDLETQDHILNYQLPVAISRFNVGLVVIDSITSNYRAEHTSTNITGMSTRSGELAKLGQLLRNLAVREDLAVVVANQVSDRFEAESTALPRGGGGGGGGGTTGTGTGTGTGTAPVSSSSPASPLPRPATGNVVDYTQHVVTLPSSPPSSSSPYIAGEEEQQQQQQHQQQSQFDGYLIGNPARSEILSLLHQQRFFTGWGDTAADMAMAAPAPPAWKKNSYYIPNAKRNKASLKTPALGLVWSTQIACRIALKKEDEDEDEGEEERDGEGEKKASQFPNTEERRRSGSGAAKSENAQSGQRQRNDDGVDDAEPEPGTEREPEKEETETETETHTNTNIRPPPRPRQPARRTMKLVFAPWTGGGADTDPRDEVQFEIWEGGLRGLNRREELT